MICGTSGSSGTSGRSGWIRSWNTNEYCPKCGSNNGDVFDFHVNCDDCNWWGSPSQLLTKEQWINESRFKKLTEILQ